MINFTDFQYFILISTILVRELAKVLIFEQNIFFKRAHIADFGLMYPFCEVTTQPLIFSTTDRGNDRIDV